MKVVFVYNGYESLGIEYLSSYIKAHGHQTELFFMPDVFSGDIINIGVLGKATTTSVEAAVRKIEHMKPDLVAFSVFTGNYRRFLDIAESVKTHLSVPIVFGGIHVTAVPSRVMANEFIDFAIIGEGEKGLLDLITHIEEQNDLAALADIPNLCWRGPEGIITNKLSNYISDLDSLPFPDKELFFSKVPAFEKNYMIATARGCPYKCTFCSNSLYRDVYNFEDKHVRKRSVESCIDELRVVKQRGIARRINFTDEVFTTHKKWLQDFIEIYRSEIGIPFSCNVYPMTVNREVAQILKEGGCYFVTMGVQTGSDRIRNEIYGRREKNERVYEAASYIKDAGLQLSIDHIFGAPTEGKEDLEASLSLYSRIQPNRLITATLTYFPKTHIIDVAKQEGILTDDDVNKIEEGVFGSFTHTSQHFDKKMSTSVAYYQLLFQLLCVSRSDKSLKVVSAILRSIPSKPVYNVLSILLFVINGVLNSDYKLWHHISYIWTKKK